MQTMLADYPNSPGYKERGATSQESAESEAPRAARLRDAVLGLLEKGPATADEVADALQETVLAIRPRLSELRKMGKLEPTGKRRPNHSGKSAQEWRAARAQVQPQLPF